MISCLCINLFIVLFKGRGHLFKREFIFQSIRLMQRNIGRFPTSKRDTFLTGLTEEFKFAKCILHISPVASKTNGISPQVWSRLLSASFTEEIITEQQETEEEKENKKIKSVKFSTSITLGKLLDTIYYLADHFKQEQIQRSQDK